MSEVRDARHMLDQAERAAIAGDLASADELLRSAARIQEAELGPLHPDLASTLNNLGIIAEKTGQLGDAEASYRRAAAIASASLPSDHPTVADTRKTLEDFCRERGLPIDAPVVAATSTPVSATPPSPSGTPLSVPRPTTATAAPPLPPALPSKSRSVAWVAIGVVALLAAAVLVWRASSSREASTAIPATAPAAQQAIEPPLPPPTKPALIEQAQPSRIEPRGGSPDVVTRKPPASARSTAAVSLATTQLCQTFSTSGSNWKCDPVGDSVSRRPIVLYTRVRSPRDTAVVHRWYRGNTLRQSAKLAIRANATDGYRTYSRFSVDDVGDWRVEVRSMDGDLLYEQQFAVR
jgi:Protein of unknown function (DUF2914)/Tetratricopeptide repeat